MAMARGRRWPSLGVSFAATGLQRRGDGVAGVFSLWDFGLGFWAGAVVLFIHWRVAAERRGGADDFVFYDCGRRGRGVRARR